MMVEGIDDVDESFVYEQLAGIRSAFERLIDRYGYGAIEDTMSKVVTVLEQFETLVSYKRQSRLRLINAELMLEEEKESNTHHQQLANRRGHELQEQNQRLLEENARLEREIEDTQSDNTVPTRQRDDGRLEDTSEVLTKLNDVISVQTTTLNELREEYDEMSAHGSKQSALILKLKAALQESVHSQKVLQARNDALCNELAVLEAQSAASELERGTGVRSRSDSCTQSEDRSSWGSLDETRHAKHDELPEDKDIQAAKLEYTRSAVQVIRDVLSSYSPSTRKRRVNKCSCEQSGYKFSVDEMTLLINERNIAKEKLAATEEELEYYREREGVDDMTDEGFAILDPPRTSSASTIATSSASTMTRTLFRRVSRSDDT